MKRVVGYDNEYDYNGVEGAMDEAMRLQVTRYG